MTPRFKSKHQKLILQCYPAGKAPDKRPNPSELSYLLYYVSTRRAKLTKVGLFLEQKAQSDVYKGRAGNVQVTLDILKNIIERCPEDINLFAKNVVSILDAVISSNDLSLSTHAAPVFDTFCRSHDGVLFRGDPLYVKDFQHLVGKYFEIAKGSDTGPNSLQWKLVGVEALKSLASCVVLSTPAGAGLVESMIPILLSCLSPSDDGANLLLLQKQVASVERNRRTSIQLERHGNQQLMYASMEVLYRLFDTTSTDLVRKATNSVIKHILPNNYPLIWSTTLLEVATTCSPVQTRFAVVTELVDTLSALPLTDIASLLCLIKLITSLLSSSVNMVGLSVIDVLRSLLHLQSNILRSNPSESLNKGRSSSDNLLAALKDCMAALASHIYYAAQVSDMISEILARCHASNRIGLTSGAATPMNGSLSKGRDIFNASEKTHGINDMFLVNSLNTIQSILVIYLNKSGGVEKNHLSILSWDGTQHLLNHENENVRTAYANALITFLNSCTTPHDYELKGMPFQVLEGPFGGLISALYTLATSASSHQYLLVYHVLKAMVKAGNRSLLRTCSLAVSLDRLATSVITGDQNYSVEQSIAFGSISYATLYHIGQEVESASLISFTKEEIDRRQAQNVWYSPIDVTEKRTLNDDLTLAQSVITGDEMGSIDSMQPLNEPLVVETLSHAITDFEPMATQVLNTDLSLGNILAPGGHGLPTLKVLSSDSDENNRAHRAHSLKQLHSRILSSSPGSNPVYLSPMLAATQRPSDDNVNDISGYVQSQNAGRSLEPSITGRSITNDVDLRRDFSPRVRDLKKAASGYHVRVNPPSINGGAANGYVRSLHSRKSSEGESLSSRPGSPRYLANENGNANGYGHGNEKVHVPTPQNNTLDVMSFLSSLTVDSENDRGRLI